jgi:hypothetical protein
MAEIAEVAPESRPTGSAYDRWHWIDLCRQQSLLTTSGFHLIPEVKTAKGDIAASMSEVGCIAEVVFVYIDDG